MYCLSRCTNPSCLYYLACLFFLACLCFLACLYSPASLMDQKLFLACLQNPWWDCQWYWFRWFLQLSSMLRYPMKFQNLYTYVVTVFNCICGWWCVGLKKAFNQPPARSVNSQSLTKAFMSGCFQFSGFPQCWQGGKFVPYSST